MMSEKSILQKVVDERMKSALREDRFSDAAMTTIIIALMAILALLIIVLIVSSTWTHHSEPKFRSGDIVAVKLGGQKGRVFSAVCRGVFVLRTKPECGYNVRFASRPHTLVYMREGEIIKADNQL